MHYSEGHPLSSVHYSKVASVCSFEGDPSSSVRSSEGDPSSSVRSSEGHPSSRVRSSEGPAVVRAPARVDVLVAAGAACDGLHSEHQMQTQEFSGQHHGSGGQLLHRLEPHQHRRVLQRGAALPHAVLPRLRPGAGAAGGRQGELDGRLDPGVQPHGVLQQIRTQRDVSRADQMRLYHVWRFRRR